jgi:hypothetical protein
MICPKLTTEETNMVNYFWSQLHFTPDEFEEYWAIRTRMEDIHAAAGSVHLGREQNREYMKLSQRSTQFRDIIGKRVIANHAMRDRVWPELAPRALRCWKFQEKPQLTKAEVEESMGLLEWLSKLRKEALKTTCQALEAAGKAPAETSKS